DCAPVCDRVGQTAVAVVLSFNDVEPFGRHPREGHGSGCAPPGHSTARNGLVMTIEDDGVVRLSSAKHIAPPIVQVIREGSRINQDRVAGGMKLKAQRV